MHPTGMQYCVTTECIDYIMGAYTPTPTTMPCGHAFGGGKGGLHPGGWVWDEYRAPVDRHIRRCAWKGRGGCLPDGIEPVSTLCYNGRRL